MSQSIDGFLRSLGLQRYATQLKQKNILTVDDLKMNIDKFPLLFNNPLAVQRIEIGLGRVGDPNSDAATPQPPQDPLREWERRLQERLREISRQRARLVIGRAGRVEVLQISQEADRGNTSLRLCHKALRLKERLVALRREARVRRASAEGMGGGSDIAIESGEVKAALRETLQLIKELPHGWGMGDVGDNIPMMPPTPHAASDRSASTPVRRHVDVPGPSPTPPMTPTSQNNNIPASASTAAQDELFERLEGMLSGKERATADGTVWLKQAFMSLSNQVRSLQNQLQVLYEIQHTVNRLDISSSSFGNRNGGGGRGRDAGSQTDAPTLLDITCGLAAVVERNCGTLVSVPPPSLMVPMMQAGTSFPAQWNAFVCFAKEVHCALEEGVKGDMSSSLRDMEPLDVTDSRDADGVRAALGETQASLLEVVGELKRRLADQTL